MRSRGLLVLALAGLLAACTSPDAEPTGGGLPGAVPSDVTFRSPPAAAPPAPSFELELLSGEVLDSAEQWSDRPMVLVFFETWCELCRDQQPGISELADDYGDVVLFLGIAGQSSVDDVREFVVDNDITYPVAVDAAGDVWLRYAAAEPPLVALISKAGKLLRGWPGGTTAEVLREQIENLAVSR